MERNKVLIGTRGSRLALIQAQCVKEALEGADPAIRASLVTIKTTGDRISDIPLAKIGDKGLFIREIEEALLRGDIDCAVHSLKDLPTGLPDGLELGAVLERGETRDALISAEGKTLNEISGGEAIATSSLRRRAQLLSFNPAFEVCDMRGNIDTRLRKMEEGSCAALVLAGCGLIRAGFGHMITQLIDPRIMVPAVCQGIIGIEIRMEDNRTAGMLKAINHSTTFLAALAEREFMRTLEGGCQVPVGCHTRLREDSFEITGLLSDLDGKRRMKREHSGRLRDAVEIANELAVRMLSAGGDHILRKVREEHGKP